MFGNNMAHVPHLIKIFARILNTNLITADTSTKISSVLRWCVSGNVPQNILQASWDSLSNDARTKLQKFMSEQPPQPSQAL